MSASEADQFNFVGLARSPVQQTPQTGYYSSRGGETTGGRESAFGSATGESSIRSDGDSSSSSCRRRRALRSVTPNLLGDSHDAVAVGAEAAPETPTASPSSLALLSSSISKRKAELAKRAASVPVSRTLKLSPASTVASFGSPSASYLAQAEAEAEARGVSFGRGADSGTTLTACRSEDKQDGGAEFNLDRDGGIAPFAHLTAGFPTPQPSGSRGGSPPAAEAPAPSVKWQPSPSMVCSSSLAVDRASATPQNSSTAQDACLPRTPATEDRPEYCYVKEQGWREGGSVTGNYSDSSFGLAVFSPDPSSPAPSSATGAGNRVGVGRAGRVSSGKYDLSPQRASPTEVSGSSPSSSAKYRRNTAGSPQQDARMDKSRTGRSCYGNSISSRADLATSSMRPRRDVGGQTVEGKLHGDDDHFAAQDTLSTPADTARHDRPSTPAAAAALAMMMTRGCDTYQSKPLRSEDVEQEEDWDEGDDNFSEEPSRMSTDVRAATIAASPGSPRQAVITSMRRPVMTPRRPMAASALLELSAGTPRGMIRGIIGGRIPSNNTSAQRPRQKQQHHNLHHQRFVPGVSKVPEDIEEETPRTFIKGIVAETTTDSSAALGRGQTATQASRPQKQPYQSATVAAAAAAAAVAAAKCSADSTRGPESSPQCPSSTSGVLSRPSGTRESAARQTAARARDTSTSGAEPKAKEQRELLAAAHPSGTTHKALTAVFLLLIAIGIFLVAGFGVTFLLYLAFADPVPQAPIH